jgi:hypothetical protein
MFPVSKMQHGDGMEFVGYGEMFTSTSSSSGVKARVPGQTDPQPWTESAVEIKAMAF